MKWGGGVGGGEERTATTNAGALQSMHVQIGTASTSICVL